MARHHVTRSVEAVEGPDFLTLTEYLYVGGLEITHAPRVHLSRDDAEKVRDAINRWLIGKDQNGPGWLTREMERIG